MRRREERCLRAATRLPKGLPSQACPLEYQGANGKEPSEAAAASATKNDVPEEAKEKPVMLWRLLSPLWIGLGSNDTVD